MKSRLDLAREAFDARGRLVAEVVCGECTRRRVVGHVYESPLGLIVVTETTIPGGRDFKDEDKAFYRQVGRNTTARRPTSTNVMFVDDRRNMPAECRHHDRLTVTAADVTDAAARYAQHPSKPAIIRARAQHSV